MTALLLLLGCASELVPEDRFEVAGAAPADGELEVLTTAHPELRLSQEADAALCDAQHLGLAALNEDGFIAFEVDLEVELVDGGHKAVLHPAAPLRATYTYAYVVRSGSAGCQDTDGRVLEPFYAEFEVP